MRAALNTTRFLSLIALTIALATGCASVSKSARVRVVAAPAPAISLEAQLPAVPDSHPELPLIISERGRFTDPHALKFVAAREAFWNYDTDTAVRLLRELRAEKILAEDNFHWLVLQCYEQSDRWAEVLPLFAEFGIEESQAGWRQLAQFRASLRPREIDIASDGAPIPLELKYGDLPIVIAEINGEKTRLLIDTGAGITWLSEGLARAAGVDVSDQKVSLYDAHDRAVDTPMAVIRELRLGGLTVRHAPALVGSSLLLKFGTGVDGILGWELLQHLDITFDFPARQMTLARPRAGISDKPNLSGRSAPILTTMSAEGRPLHLYFDTGASAGRAYVELFDNDGLVATKTPVAQFSLPWRPTFGVGIHSFSIAWPRMAQPFEFWMAGYRFQVPTAVLYKGTLQKERFAYVDGLIGNAPFLGGRLRICGVRREISFEPGR